MVAGHVLTPNTSRARVRGHVGFRSPEPEDGQELWALAGRVDLDLNSPYAYVLWGDHFADTSVVAVLDGAIVGFTIGFRLPSDADVLFVWQIGVDEAGRGAGIAGAMLDELVDRTNVREVEATVTPSNRASTALFRGLAARHGATTTESVAYGEGLFPPGHEAEIRFRIPVGGPGTGSAAPPPPA